MLWGSLGFNHLSIESKLLVKHKKEAGVWHWRPSLVVVAVVVVVMGEKQSELQVCTCPMSLTKGV